MKYITTPLAEIKARASIVKVINEYIKLKKSGPNHLGLCFNHQDKTPSLCVSESKGIYTCFTCGITGDVFSFLTTHNNVTIFEAAETVANICGISLEYSEKEYTKEQLQRVKEIELMEKALNAAINIFSSNAKQSEQAKRYIKERKFSEESLSEFRIGWADDSNSILNKMQELNLVEPAIQIGLLRKADNDKILNCIKNRLIFPIENHYGKAVGVTARILLSENDIKKYKEQGKKVNKYINLKTSLLYQKSKIVYNLNRASEAIRTKKNVLIVEGNTDVIALHEYGYNNCVATGGTSFTIDQIKLINKYTTHAVMVSDNDIAGIDSFNKSLPLLLREGFKVDFIKLPKKDADKFLRDSGTPADNIKLPESTDAVLFRCSELLSEVNDLHVAAANKKEAIELIKNIPDKILLSEYIKRICDQFNLDDTIFKSENNIAQVTQKNNNISQNDSNGIDKITDKFFDVVYDTKKGLKKFIKIEIEEYDFIKWLLSIGVRRYDLQQSFSFVMIENNIIKEMQIRDIVDTVRRTVNKYPDIIEENVTREDLLKILIKHSKKLFEKTLLQWLSTDDVFEFNKDSKSECYSYYKNGYVKCSNKHYSFHSYSQIQKFIWKEQMMNRDFNELVLDASVIETTCIFATFMYNAVGKNKDKFLSLCSIIGYLLHDFTEGKLKAIVLTDENMSPHNEGRTGKTLIGEALANLRNVCNINGKEFDPNKAFKYQKAQISSQILFLNDIKKNFDLECLYNDITDGITIEKKNANPITKKIKYLITSNRVIKTEGASSKDRIIEFEFSNHYSDQFSPEMEFKHWFFRDWNNEEWLSFDNFIMHCICIYLDKGLISTDQKNLQLRKLISFTCYQFFEFIRDIKLQPGEEFSLQDLKLDFEEKYPEIDLANNNASNTSYPTRRFSDWLRQLPVYHIEFLKTKMKQTRKSGSNVFYKFISTDYNEKSENDKKVEFLSSNLPFTV
jgi:DNA primase